MLRTARFRTVKVRIPAGAVAGTAIKFLDQDDLRGALIDAVETYTASDQALTDEGGTVVSDADGVRLVVSLVESSDARVEFLPYYASRAVLLAGIIRRLSGWSITWPQCSVRVVQDIASEKDVYAVIGVHYRYPSDPA